MDLYKHPLFQDRLEGATRVAVDILKDTHPGFRWNLNPDGSVSITRGHSKTVIRNEFEHNNNKVFSGFTLTRCVLRDGYTPSARDVAFS